MSAASDGPAGRVLLLGVDTDAVDVAADRIASDDPTRVRERVTDPSVRCVVVAHDPPRVDAPTVAEELGRDVPVVLCGPVDETVLSAAVSAGIDEYATDTDELPAALDRATRTRSPADDGGIGGRGREVLERVSDGFFALDPSFRVQYVNEAGAEMLRATPAELEGEILWDRFPEAVGSTFEREYRRAMASGDPTTFEEYYPPLGAWFEVQAYPSDTGLSVYFRDVTDRKVRETNLETRTRQFEAVLGNPLSPVVMLHADGTVFNANDAALDAIDAALGDVSGRPFWKTSWIPEETDAMREAVTDAIAGDRTRLEVAFGTAADRTVDLAVNPVTDDDGVVGVVVAGRDITERVRYERQVERQRTQLAAVTRVASVARDVNQALDRLECRSDLEQFVCDRFVDVTDFDLAWVGRVDAVTDTLSPVAAAGGAVSYLDGIRVGVGDDDPTGPAARAVHTKSMQVVRDVTTAPEFEPWRESARDHGLGACVAIPITYGGTLYGVLCVYTADGEAVGGTVRPMLRQFDTVLGHALAAADRRLALTADRHVELTFDVAESFLTRAAAAAEGEVSLAGRVSPTDDRTLRYLSVSGDAASLASLAAERTSSARAVSDGENGVVEVVHESSTLGQELAARGVVVDDYTASAEGGTLVVRHPAEMETRRAVDAVDGCLDDVNLRARRETTAFGPPERPDALLDDALTDRQRAAIQTAYYAGYFEWPRESTAEELAAAMDIAGPTFHQHLRSAHRKVLERLVDGTGP